MQPVRYIEKQPALGRLCWLCGLLLWLCWNWLAATGAVQAHALLIRSIPEANAVLSQPPRQIDLWFSEPLEEGFNRVRLLTSTGQEIIPESVRLDGADPNHLTVFLQPLEPGIYTVAWQNLSRVDGHEWSGSFPFTILNPDGSPPGGVALAAADSGRGELPSPAEIVARWLGLLGGMLLFGIPVFRLFVMGQTEPDGSRLELGSLALPVIWLAVLAVVVGGWLQLLLQSLRLGGLGQLPDLLLFSRSGVLGLIRQVVALSGLMMILSLPQPRPLHDPEWRFFSQLIAGGLAGSLLLLLTITRAGWAELILTFGLAAWALGLVVGTFYRKAEIIERRLWRSLLLMAAVLLLTFSLSSHAGAVAGRAWAVIVDYVHLLAAAVWLGGLLLLALLAWQDYRTGPGKTQFWRTCRRFSYLAGFSIFVLAVTGLFSSLVQLPAFTSLLQTAYGRTLLVKLLLIGLVLPIAFLNNRLVRRQTNTARQGQRFRRSVTVEAIVSLVILASVAILVQTTTPRSLVPGDNGLEVGRPFGEVIKADDLNVHLQILPGQVGQNTFIVHLYGDDNAPVGEVQLVRLFFDYQEPGLGRASADLQPGSQQNIFNISGAYLNQSGWWDITAYVRRRGLDDLLAEYKVEISSPSRAAASTGPWQNPIPAIPAGILIAAGGLMAVGAAAFMRIRPLK